MTEQHKFVLKLEDGYTSWTIICPDGGKECKPASSCASCGRTIGDDEISRCYDCPTTTEVEGCWVQSWAGEMLAEEVLHGTVEIEFPVSCEWNGDGLEAHVMGPANFVKSMWTD